MVNKRKNRIKLLISYFYIFLILLIFGIVIPEVLESLVERLPGLYKKHMGNSIFVNSFTRSYLVDNIKFVFMKFFELIF